MSTLPNTQPIYSKDVFNWDVRLTNQVCGRKLSSELPAAVGTAGTFGSIIWNIRALPLGANVSTVFRLYTVHSSENTLDNYRLLFEVKLPTISNVVSAGVNVPIGGNGNGVNLAPTPIEVPLPRIYTRNSDESRGLILSPGQYLYCGLSVAVDSGWDIRVEGGHY